MKIKCQVCKIDGYLQHIGKSYYRVRHYAGFKNGKPVFKYHRQEPEYVQALLGQGNNGEFDHIDQKRVDQNLYASGSFNQKGPWAGSLVRTGHKPPKLVVVGSNPTPPAKLASKESEICTHTGSLFLMHAKRFYKRGDAYYVVTLTHVTYEAPESFLGMHEENLWQEK